MDKQPSRMNRRRGPVSVLIALLSIAATAGLVIFSSSPQKAGAQPPPPTTVVIPPPPSTGGGGPSAEGPCAFVEFSDAAGKMTLTADYEPGDPPIPTAAYWDWYQTNYPSGSTSKSIDTTVTVNGVQYPVSDADHQDDSPGYDEHGQVTSPWQDASGFPHVLEPGDILSVRIVATFYPSLNTLTMQGSCQL